MDTIQEVAENKLALLDALVTKIVEQAKELERKADELKTMLKYYEPIEENWR